MSGGWSSASSDNEDEPHPRSLVPTKPKEKRTFNLERWRSQANDAEQAKLLPHIPLLRDECIFMTPNYRRIVQQRKLELARKEQTRRVEKHFSRHQMPDAIVETSAVMRNQSKRQRQEQWLTLIACSRFIAVHEKAARMTAMNTLRKLLAPVIRRARANVRRRNRENMILAACENEMCRPTAETLREASPLFASLTLASLEDLAAKFSPAAVSPDRMVIPFEAREADICLLDKGTIEVLTMQRSNYGVMELQRTGDLISQRNTIFGDLNQVKMRAPIAFRAHAIRVLYWRLSPIHYHTLASRTIPREVFNRNSAAVRQKYLPVTNPPTCHGLQNCGNNTMYSEWPDAMLDLLRSCLKPACYPPQHVFWNPGEEATTFFFIAEGFCDIYKRSRPTLDHEIAAAELLHETDGKKRSPSPTGGGADFSSFLDLERSMARQSESDEVATKMKLGELSPMQLKLVATAGPWRCLGVNATVTMDRRSTRLVARNEVDCWECDRSTMLRLLAAHPRLYVKVKEGLSASKLERMTEDAGASLKPVLRNDPLFAGVSEKALKQISSTATACWLSRHEYVRLNSDSSFIVVTRGSLSVRCVNEAKLAASPLGMSRLCHFLDGCGTLFAPNAISGQHLTHYLNENEVSTVCATELFELSVPTVLKVIERVDGIQTREKVTLASRTMLGRELFEIPRASTLRLVGAPPKSSTSMK